MTTLPIIVYGNGNLYYQYFEAIVRSFGDTKNIYSSLLHLTILLAGMTVLFSFVMKREIMEMVRWMGRVYLVVYILFLPKITVEIIDTVNQKPYTVDHVPLGLAIVASVSSTVSDNLTRLTEMNFSMPDDLRYHQHGMVFASEMAKAVGQFEITDSRFDENIQGFINQCVFYDILLHKYSLSDLMQTGDIWQLVSKKASPARAFVYRGSDGQANVVTCRDSISSLSSDWKAALAAAEIRYGGRMFPSAANKRDALTKYIDISYGYLTGLSGQADRIMKQALMANAIQRGVLRMAATVDAAAAMQSYAYVRAMEQKRLTNQTVGDMAAYWLPLIRNALELVLYGSFIFVILIGIFPFGARTLQSWGLTLLWLKLWPPLYAIVNLTISCYAQKHSLAATGGVFSLQSMPGLLQINADMAGLAGYLSMSVPAISGGLLWGMNHAFHQLSQYVGGVVQSTAGMGAGEAVTGNIGFGNTNFGNHSAFNTSANHIDTSMRFSGGQMMMQSTDGARMTIMPDGSHVMDMAPTVSNLGASFDTGTSIRNAQSENASHAITAARQSAVHYSHAMTSGMRNLLDVAHHMNNSESSSEGWTATTSTGVSDAIGKINQTVSHMSHSLGISEDEARNVATNIFAEGRAGVGIHAGTGDRGEGGGGLLGKILPISIGISASGSGGISRTAGSNTTEDHRELHSRAKDIMDNENFAHNVDVVARSAKDGTLRATSDEGTRAIEGMTAAFDEAENYRDDMQASLNEADNYQKNASHASESSFSIRAPVSNEFSHWLEAQASRDGNGHLGQSGARAVLKDVDIRQKYFDKFSAEQQAQMTSPFASLAHADQSIRNDYSHLSSNIQAHKNVASHWNMNRENMVGQAKDNNWYPVKPVDHSLQQTVEDGIAADRTRVDAGSKQESDHQKIADAEFSGIEAVNKRMTERMLLKNMAGFAEKLNQKET